jgi:hypothetical protein
VELELELELEAELVLEEVLVPVEVDEVVPFEDPEVEVEVVNEAAAVVVVVSWASRDDSWLRMLLSSDANCDCSDAWAVTRSEPVRVEAAAPCADIRDACSEAWAEVYEASMAAALEARATPVSVTVATEVVVWALRAREPVVRQSPF